jgi:hypothetical protein
MLKDSKLVWVIEYLIGIALLVAVLPFIIHPQQGWSPAHGWAYLLFIACSGITLLGFASAMRQRIALSERITKLEQIIENRTQNQTECAHKNKASEQFVGSVN